MWKVGTFFLTVFTQCISKPQLLALCCVNREKQFAHHYLTSAVNKLTHTLMKPFVKKRIKKILLSKQPPGDYLSCSVLLKLVFTCLRGLTKSIRDNTLLGGWQVTLHTGQRKYLPPSPLKAESLWQWLCGCPCSSTSLDHTFPPASFSGITSHGM